MEGSIQEIVKFSRSETTQDLSLELEKLYDLQYEIHTALESGKGEDTLDDYNLLIALFYFG